MQPRNPYQGQPTSNMSFPTEAYMAAAANAAKIQADAQAQMGRAIGQGIEKIGSAIGDYKKMSSEVKSSEKFFESMRGYLPPELTKGIDSIVGGPDYKHMSTAEKANIWGNIKSYTGESITQRNIMERIKANNPARPAPSYPAPTLEESPLSSPAPSPAPSGGMMVGPNLGDDMASPPVYDKDQTDYIDFMKKKGWAGGPVKQAWIDEYNKQRAFPQPLPR